VGKRLRRNKATKRAALPDELENPETYGVRVWPCFLSWAPCIHCASQHLSHKVVCCCAGAAAKGQAGKGQRRGRGGAGARVLALAAGARQSLLGALYEEPPARAARQVLTPALSTRILREAQAQQAEVDAEADLLAAGGAAYASGRQVSPSLCARRSGLCVSWSSRQHKQPWLRQAVPH